MGDDGLTYRDALKVLGSPRSRLVTWLDAVASAGLTAWVAAGIATGMGPEIPVSLLELKNEVVPYCHRVIRQVAEWYSGLSRFDRSQRLIAAHTVLVVSSYFEALDQTELPVPLERIALSREEQAGLAAESAVPGSYAELLDLLLRSSVPVPQPNRPYTQTQEALASFYNRLSYELTNFVGGLSVWEELNDTQRRQLSAGIEEAAPRALQLYDEAYRNLAADSREFAVWAGLTELHALGTGLTRVSELLTEMAIYRPGDRPLAHLRKLYRAALDQPIAGAGREADEVVFPPLGSAYLNPECRVAEVRPGDTPALPAYWETREKVADIAAFLAGYLTSPQACRLPLVVLGEPGSGKSKLTQVLAARLPGGDFLPVRVELRDVAAESMVQEQIEETVYRSPGERVSWLDLVEAAGGALPVVMLDGFDELVQASGVNRYDYLEQVRDFQLRQMQIGHPVAVIVTSRTLMADHARFPAGTLALRLEPFSREQVGRWLGIWAQYNQEMLSRRNLRPLPAEVAMSYGELASQPLLLMLLAIFDATSNVLQHGSRQLSQVALYEGVLKDFALREVRKHPPNRALPTGELARLAEDELHQLSLVALAMFARGRQSVAETELDHDLGILSPRPGTEHSGEGMPLSRAQRATGRFFFVHRSEAQARDTRVRSYEFLHATFGEYLVARLAVRALRDLTAFEQARRQGITAGAAELDDGFLHAVLSFSCPTARDPVIFFLDALLQQIPADEQSRCQQLLPVLLDAAVHPRASRSFQRYEPVKAPIPRRVATYSASLLLMLVLLTGEAHGHDLFGREAAAARLRELGYLWRGWLTSAEWRGLTRTLRVNAQRTGGMVDVVIGLDNGSPVSPTDSIILSAEVPFHSDTDYDMLAAPADVIPFDVALDPLSRAGVALKEAAFTPDWHTSMLLLPTVPYLRAAGGELRIEQPGGALVLSACVLAHLDYTRDASPEDRARFYEWFIEAMTSNLPLARQLLLRLREDARAFPVKVTVALLRTARNIVPIPLYTDLVNELWKRAARTSRKADSSEVRLLMAEIAGCAPAFFAFTTRASHPIEEAALVLVKEARGDDDLPALSLSVGLHVPVGPTVS
ncbi:MAG TPA: hypothetical protein VGS19_32110 [Streptosporangiaceae bacterium]|nr:hypothetical protein [Streptosporangiaceae bacterium]